MDRKGRTKYTLYFFSVGFDANRDREHASIIASNFPDGSTDDQIRHFFRHVRALPPCSSSSSNTLVRHHTSSRGCAKSEYEYDGKDRNY
jgi:hypothetical protein